MGQDHLINGFEKPGAERTVYRDRRLDHDCANLILRHSLTLLCVSASPREPHKPVLLLSILDLLDRGTITDNRISLSDELARSFRRYFDVVRDRDDQPTIQYPYFHLSGDHFWQLVPPPGETPIYRSGATSGAPTVAELRRRVAYGQFDDRLWALMNDPQSRCMLRNALIARYFPERREQLEAVCTAPLPAQQALRDQQPPGRDAAFRHAILEIYDYRCAACGVRVLLNPGLSLVEAAHLIPFGVSRNDKPTRGSPLNRSYRAAVGSGRG